MLIDPNQVKVSDRQRKDLGDIAALAKSITDKGQISPVVVDKKFNLIAGQRRVLACIEAGIEVWAETREGLSSTQKFELELEENIMRKELTPQEECDAKLKLFELKQKLLGVKGPGQSLGFSQKDLATELDESVGTISGDLELAQAMREYGDKEAYKELHTAKTKQAMFQAVKKYREGEILQELEKRAPEIYAKESTAERIIYGDCLDILPRWHEVFDIVATDPPFGIDLKKVRKRKYNHKIDFDYQYQEDSEEPYWELMNQAIPLIYKAMKRDSHLYIWFGIQFYFEMRELLRSAGFVVDIFPIIWAKQQGQTLHPDMYPGRTYETCFYARKGQLPLAEQGKPNLIIGIKPVHPEKKLHPAQKPVALWENLLHRSSFPGALILDPFCGVGGAIKAASNMGLVASGVELSLANRQIAASVMEGEVELE